MKVVKKPWGEEHWLELSDRYCCKRILIHAGHRTSLQYHRQKLETNYIVSGRAEVWLEHADGVLERRVMAKDEFFTVMPLRKHRVVALDDLVMLETSTPEVDDVVRIEDDSGRGDGRIDSEHAAP